MLIFPLKKEWYEKIRSGEKRIEYREVKPYWTKRFWKETGGGEENFFNESAFGGDIDVPFDDIGRCVGWFRNLRCKLRLGYTDRYMTANIVWIAIVDGKDTDLHIDKPVYAIHLANVREYENA